MVLDGKNASINLKQALKEEIDVYCRDKNRKPCLVIIQANNNEDSDTYIKNKIKACEFVGIQCIYKRYLETVTKETLLDEINKLNNDDTVDGIIVQLPLFKHLEEQTFINAVSPEKDVDGFCYVNKGKLFTGAFGFRPATPTGVMRLLELYNIDVEGMNAVVIGRSNIVGKPMAMMLLEKNATVTMCHSKSKDLKYICKKADLIVSAIGKPNFIDEEYVKEGSILIDVGINYINGKLCGDIDYDKVKDIASYITPVPGGVGPLTVTMLLYNTFLSYKIRMGK